MGHTIYLDESGDHHNPGAVNNIKKRYLCLNGVIIANNKYPDICNQWNSLRKLFIDKNNKIPPLHFHDVINKQGCFNILRNEEIQESFNKLYLAFLSAAPLTIIAIVIDKQKIFDNYATPDDPYGASLKILLDGYIHFLKSNSSTGNIIIESRNKTDNNKLKQAYLSYYKNGGYNRQHIDTSTIKNHLADNVLFYTKDKMEVGLEISDMLATIMKFFILSKYNLHNLTNNFSMKVLKEVESKIRSHKGEIKGTGIILFPHSQ